METENTAILLENGLLPLHTQPLGTPLPEVSSKFFRVDSFWLFQKAMQMGWDNAGGGGPGSFCSAQRLVARVSSMPHLTAGHTRPMAALRSRCRALSASVFFGYYGKVANNIPVQVFL